jgi:hypothetical protein
MSETLSFGDVPYDRLLRIFSSEAGSSPALVWRADLVKNEISFLSDAAIPGLDDIIPCLLQDAAGAESILAEQDRKAFTRFHERMRQRQPVSEVFRVHGRDGLMRWLYILGAPDPEISFGYLGLATDCTGIANGILQRGSETGIAEHVELFDNPVFMAECGSRRVFVANAAAREVFGIDSANKPLLLSDIFAANADAYMRDIYERLLFSCAWNGLLTINNAQGQAIACMSRVRAYDRDGHRSLWFSLSPRLPAKNSEPPLNPSSKVDAELALANDIRGLLRVLLDNQSRSQHVDAVMLSQIFIAEGRVAVTGVGKPFESVSENDAHPYSGSIAENMVLFGLPHIIVKDTTKSIKPIDWALFIPKGIRSYLALPLYVEGVLRKVLIFCSTRLGTFDEAKLPVYSGLAKSLWAELPRVLPDATKPPDTN